MFTINSLLNYGVFIEEFNDSSKTGWLVVVSFDFWFPREPCGGNLLVLSQWDIKPPGLINVLVIIHLIIAPGTVDC